MRRSKFLSDVWTILEMKLLFMKQGWILYFLRPLVFPIATFFWLRVLAADAPHIVQRILTGAVIFGFALSTANMLAQQIILDRFSGRLKLIITMPVSKSASYAPAQETGGIMANLVGVVLVVASPVFFSMEQAPIALKLLGWVSPMRYAADGVMKSLSGQTDVFFEFVILTMFACLSIVIGLSKLKWREV